MLREANGQEERVENRMQNTGGLNIQYRTRNVQCQGRLCESVKSVAIFIDYLRFTIAYCCPSWLLVVPLAFSEIRAIRGFTLVFIRG